MKTTIEKDHAKDQAKAQLASIREMAKALNAATTDDEREDAEQAIREDALCVEVRTDWYDPCDRNGCYNARPGEFTILLCTGGPACRIIGRLDEHGTPETARIEYQDWGTPWTDFPLTETDERSDVLDYCRVFYYGE